MQATVSITKALRQELGTHCLATVQGAGGTLTPEAVQGLVLGIQDICSGYGITVQVIAPQPVQQPAPTK